MAVKKKKEQTEGAGQPKLSMAQVGALLGRSSPWVQERKKEGWFGEIPPYGKIPLTQAVRGAVAYYEDALRNATKSNAAAGASAARTAELNQRIAIRAGQLIPIDDAEAVLMEFAGSVVAAISSIPAASTRSLEARKPIQKACDDTLDSLAKRAEEASETLGADSEGSKTAAA